MLFNSLEFVVFFPIAAGVYFALPAGWRWLWLLAASYVFYMWWEPGYVVLLWLSTVIDYIAGRAMAEAGDRVRRRWLIVSLCSNLGLLAFFKYYNFFRGSMAEVFPWAEGMPVSGFLLPVGISFYTFQTLSYTIEVYRRRQPPERHFGYFALYVAYFPQLVAGPIERASHLLPELRVPYAFDYKRVTSGLKLAAWGMIKKVVIADRVAQFVDPVYGDPGQFSGPVLLAATVLFAVQIYADFSGYTDIARGISRILGIELMLNFRRPYFATSISDFWRRWHISLSSWFRDYLYIPLGGNRVALPQWSVNILITFIVSGLWHGANWTFILWGLLHGLYLLGERVLAWALDRWRGRRRPVPHAIYPPVHNRLAAKLMKVSVTFVLVCIAWVLFRAQSVGDALLVYRGIFSGWTAWIAGTEPLFEAFRPVGFAPVDWQIAAACVAGLFAIDYLRGLPQFGERFAALPLPLRWAVYSAALWCIFALGIFREKTFIYFAF